MAAPGKLPKQFNPLFRPCAQQPTGAYELDREHPIGRKMAFVWIGGNPIAELAYNETLAPVNGVSAGPYYASFDGTDDHYLQNSNPPFLFTGNCSIISRARRSSVATHFLFTQGTGGETSDSNVQLQLGVTSSGTMRLGWEYGGGSNDIVLSSTISGTTNNWRTYGATRTFTGTDFDVDFFYDGDLVSTGNSITNPSGGAAAQNWVGTSVGTAASSIAEEWAGDIEYIYVTREALTREEMRSLTRDPYQILKPKAELFYIVSAANNVTVNASPVALTLTEQAATISYDVEVTASTDALTLTEYAASVAYDVEVTAQAAAITLATYSATVDTGGDVEVLASTAAITLTTNAAAVVYDVNLLADFAALTLTTYGAAIVATDGALNILRPIRIARRRRTEIPFRNFKIKTGAGLIHRGKPTS